MDTHTSEAEKLKNLIIVGDRVLIKPKTADEKTKTGLYLPLNVQEKEEVRSGFVMKVGPGYPIPLPAEGLDEDWKGSDEAVKYIPLQAKEGDLAIYLQKGAVEVLYQDEKYYIVSQHSILMIERYDDVY
ncbi:MAG: co-chaperone GroES [Ignavibacteriae bacterium]|nr:co-chaperone GroES [Ignavibacteriota bacterium]MCB9243655.1 co-chaperone GroES [Ignavibacteriales bacterium]